jgi:tetratricopeptide (TPR) repeat protein
MQWTDLQFLPRVPQDIRLAQQRETVARHPKDAAQHAELGKILMLLAKYEEAVAAFEQAERAAPREFQCFAALSQCFQALDRPEEMLHVCERGKEVMPDCCGVHFWHGIALRRLGRTAEASEALLKAVAAESPLGPMSSDPVGKSFYVFMAVESLLAPMASDSDGYRLLALCDELPPGYANCTVVRGYRAIALSRVGRSEEAKKVIDLDQHVARFKFDPPAEFAGIEHFNELLAMEILINPGLRYSNLGLDQTEHLDISGARAFPALAEFLRTVIEDFISEFPLRGLDVILPPVPEKGFLVSAGNVVRGLESQMSHLHRDEYVSGVYHVCVPPNAPSADNRAGALVLGSCDDITGGYVACWGSRDLKPVPGWATVFPSHLFHSVVSTQSEQPRIAIPFDLRPGIPREPPA